MASKLYSLTDIVKAWYGDKHTYEYTRKTPEEVKELYNSLGMVSSYWSS